MSMIDYPLEKIKGIVFDVDGALSPAVVPLGEDGIPRRMANLKDGQAIVLATRLGYKIAVITGAVAPGLQERFKICGIQDFYAGRLDKLIVLKEWMAKYGLEKDQVAYVGDDLPDTPSMRYVGLAVAPADACRDAMDAADYITTATGGHGVARELLEQIMRAQNTWPSAEKAFG